MCRLKCDKGIFEAGCDCNQHQGVGAILATDVETIKGYAFFCDNRLVKVQPVGTKENAMPAAPEVVSAISYWMYVLASEGITFLNTFVCTYVDYQMTP